MLTLEIFWDGLAEIQIPAGGWSAFRAWRTNPASGLHYKALLEDAVARRERAFLDKIVQGELGSPRMPLKFTTCSDNCFGGGFWNFNFTGEEAVTIRGGMERLLKLVRKVLKRLLTRDPVAMSLMQSYFGASGDATRQSLLEKFTTLGYAVMSGASGGHTILLQKHEQQYMFCSGGEMGYVLDNEKQLGRDLVSVFRRIFLTDSFLADRTKAAEDGVVIAEDYRRARSLLHELTHIVLDTDDLRLATSRPAYGRMACGILATQSGNLAVAAKEHPLNNADSLAYFACDLLLSEEDVKKKEAIAEALAD